MSEIKRHHSGSRMSQIVVHGDTIYLAGQVGTPGSSIAQQTTNCLNSVEKLLAEVGSDKSHILSVTIWLSNMDNFAGMNVVYDAWIDPANPPTRACGEARLATPDYLVEFIVIAARA